MPPLVGKVADSDHCPPALTQAIVGKNLVVFCGAGISMAAPANLPNWGGFNEALFRQIKLRAGILPGLSSEAGKILEAMTVTKATGQNAQVVPTEGFSDQVVDLLLSEEYFPALKVLDGERCNGNHNALAQLAKAGIVRAIVTTNFDTLIERAFNAIGLEFDRFISHQDYDRLGVDPARPALYKIHGSVDVPESLKDTATQKFRGLAFYVHARLAELFCNHHVLVIGSSGGDLKFGDDYLSFGQVGSNGPGITWVARPPQNPEDPPVSERVRELLERAGSKAAIAKCELPDLFSELGVPRELFNIGNEDPLVAEARANERAAAYLHTFFETKALAPLRCASFCATLLRGIGRSDSARTIENALTKTLQDIGDDLAMEDALNVAQVVAALARAACDDGEYNLGNDLALRVLKLADRVEAQGSRKSPEDVFLWNKLRSIAWNFRGLCFRMCNQMAYAAESLSQAKALIDPNSGDLALLSMIQINEAYLRWRMGAPNDEVLQLARRGSGLARRAGDMGALTAAAQLESAILFPLGEYDVALRALSVGLSAMSVSGNARQRAGLQTEMAKIALARGEIESAFKRMQDLMGELSEHPTFRASLFMQTAKALGFHPPLRDRLLQMTNTILTDFQNDRIPAEGGLNVPTRAQVEQVRDDLVASRLPDNRLLQKHAAPPRNREEQLRRLIIEHEAAGRHSELPKCFLALFDDRLGHVDPSRLLDFALGLGCAAERAHNHDLQLVACCQRMLAWQQLGELRRALDEFEELRVDGSASAQTTLAAIRAMAGSLHGLIGAAEEGERLLRSARELNVQANNLSAAATNAFSIARLAARNNDYERAINILQNEREGVYTLSNPTLVEKFERMLDDYQRGCGRKESAIPLSIGLREPLREARLTAADIPHLRSIVASPEDLLLLARFALGSGLPQEARELVLEASLGFGELRDACGIADCLSFLADIAQMQRQWEKAFEFSQMASDACSRIGDQSREVASLAVLAFCLYKLENFGGAEDAATKCLKRAEGQAPSRPLLIASYVAAAACDKRGNLFGMFGFVECFLKVYPLVKDVDDLALLRDSFQRMPKPAAT